MISSAFRRLPGAVCVGCCVVALAHCAARGAEKRPSWGACLSQPRQWYASSEAARIADNVLLYQRADGGWPKNIDMAKPLDEKAVARRRDEKRRHDSTVDNGATYTQMRYLARVHSATRIPRFRDGFLRAMDLLLRAQYTSGGWPQFLVNPTGYQRYITFNDGAMIGVVSLLRDVALGKPDFEFVDPQRRRAASKAVARGVQCILSCQIRVSGTLTAWCAQHDPKTFEPRPARSYEKASLSGCESVGIVRFLMELDQPSPAVVEAVQNAVRWFEAVKLLGIRQLTRRDPTKPRGFDKFIVKDPHAPPLWARFYEIGTNRPIFCSRDGVVRHRLADISYERRTGYAWYGTWPARLLTRDYPAWQKRWAPGKNVLTRGQGPPRR